jgi:hypothetical protein
MVSINDIDRAADRRAVIQAAATIYASGNPTMSPRDAVEIAMELEAITAEAFLGIERFDPSGDTWVLRRQQPLAIVSPANWLASLSAVRTADLDGDAAEDAAFLLRESGATGVLFVSSGTLRLLGWCDLTGFGLDQHVPPSWIPPFDGAPGQVLVVATRGGEVGFVTIAPGR